MLPENTREAKRNTAGYPAGPSRPFFPCNLLVCVCVCNGYCVTHTSVDGGGERERRALNVNQRRWLKRTHANQTNLSSGPAALHTHTRLGVINDGEYIESSPIYHGGGIWPGTKVERERERRRVMFHHHQLGPVVRRVKHTHTHIYI